MGSGLGAECYHWLCFKYWAYCRESLLVSVNIFFYFYINCESLLGSGWHLAGELAVKKLQVLWYLSHVNILLWQQVFCGVLFLSMALDSFLTPSLNVLQNYLVGRDILSHSQTSRVPAVDPSVVPGTYYSLYLDSHETETAAHSLAQQSEPYHEQLCNGTGLSSLSCKSHFTLIVTMEWWKNRRVKNFTRILQCKDKVTHAKWAPVSFALCVQLLCHPVMSNFTHIFSCISYFLWITFFYFILLHFHYTLLGKSSS